MNESPEGSDASDGQSAHLRASLAATKADLDALDISGPERPVAFGVLLAARVGLTTPAAPFGADSTPPKLETRGGAPTPAPAPGDLLGQVSTGMKISRDVVDLVYDAKDGALGVVLSGRRLADDKANATRQLAQVVAGGRQAAGLEEWTPIGAIRTVVSDYGKLDSSNFASQVQGGGLDSIFLFRGKGTNREIKVTRPGMETIAELVAALAGGTS